MKTISLSIPCYNEVENIVPVAEKIIDLFALDSLRGYHYSIEFIDNQSTDGTREKLTELCRKHPNHVKAIFNIRDFGGVSNYYGMLQTDGDCTIVLPCDFQVPFEIIPELVREWEDGAKIVCAVKEKMEENKMINVIKNLYYYLVKKFSPVSQIKNFTGAGLYDKSFVDWLRVLNDPIPSLRGMVAEYGYHVRSVFYCEQPRRSGKSKQTFFSLFCVALKNIMNYTQLLPRLAGFFGILFSCVSIIIGLVYFVLKLVYWKEFSVGIAPIVIGVFFVGGIQMLFMGFIGEYLLLINQRILNRPLVVEEKRLNFPPGNNGRERCEEQKGNGECNEICKD